MKTTRQAQDGPLIPGGLGLGFAANALVFVVIVYEMFRFIAIVFMPSFPGCEVNAALAGPRNPFSVFGTMLLIALLMTVWTAGHVVVTIKRGAKLMHSVAASLAVVACVGTMVYVQYFQAAMRTAHLRELQEIDAAVQSSGNLPEWRRQQFSDKRIHMQELWDRAEGNYF